MDREIDAMMIKVRLHLRPVKIVDVEIGHSEASSPLLVAGGKIDVCRVEDTIDEGEVVFDLFVAFDVEADVACRGFGLLDCGFEV